MRSRCIGTRVAAHRIRMRVKFKWRDNSIIAKWLKIRSRWRWTASKTVYHAVVGPEYDVLAIVRLSIVKAVQRSQSQSQ
jgi:hypothetical protein